MHKPKQMDGWEFSDSIQVPDGYYMKSIPDLTRDNFNQLVDEYNNLADIINILLDNAHLTINESGTLERVQADANEPPMI